VAIKVDERVGEAVEEEKEEVLEGGTPLIIVIAPSVWEKLLR